MITQQEIDKLARALYDLQIENGFDDRVDSFLDWLSECGHTVPKPGSAAESAGKEAGNE